MIHIIWIKVWVITSFGLQLGVLPEMDREAPGLFTARKRILQDFAKENMVNGYVYKGTSASRQQAVMTLKRKWSSVGPISMSTSAAARQGRRVQISN